MSRSAKWSIPAAVVFAAMPMAAAAQQQLPTGVTAAMIEEGKTLFASTALCSSCHGEAGAGTPLAPNLGDAEWLHVDGSYDAIVQVIETGVPMPKNTYIPMVPRGGSSITDPQLRSVAAYVWSLSNK
jgi:mono/diheme cytochrome c family protein